VREIIDGERKSGMNEEIKEVAVKMILRMNLRMKDFQYTLLAFQRGAGVNILPKMRDV